MIHSLPHRPYRFRVVRSLEYSRARNDYLSACAYHELYVVHLDAAAPRLVPIGNFDQPLYVTSPPHDQRVFVVEKRGTIKLVGGGTFMFKDAVKTAFPNHQIQAIRDPMFANVRGFQIAGENLLSLEAGAREDGDVAQE